MPTTVFDSSPLKTGIHPAKDGDILCAIENYDIDNNGDNCDNDDNNDNYDNDDNCNSNGDDDNDDN